MPWYMSNERVEQIAGDRVAALAVNVSEVQQLAAEVKQCRAYIYYTLTLPQMQTEAVG